MLSDPVEVSDDLPPRPERKGDSEAQIEENNCIARDQAEIRKTNEFIDERRKYGPQFGPNVFFHEADQRIKSRLFFSLETEGKKRLLQNYAHVDIATINFRDFYNHCETLCNRDKNYIIERVNLYNTQQESTLSVQRKNNIQNRTNRAQNSRGKFNNRQNQNQQRGSKPCYFCGKEFSINYKL